MLSGTATASFCLDSGCSPGADPGCGGLHVLYENTKKKAPRREELSVGVMLSQLETVNDLGAESYSHTKTPQCL